MTSPILGLCVAIWFSLSVLLLIIVQFVLFIWLWKEKRLKFFDIFVGVPGYMDRIYMKWCVDNGRSYRLVINIRSILLINAILAGVAFAFTVNDGKMP